MTEEPKAFPSQLQAQLDACYEHASALIQSAKRLLTPDPQPNIAYHLAVLALEEVGKATLIVMGHMGAMRDGSEPAWIAKHAANHVKKLFHSLWGPTFGHEPLSGAQLAEYQELARMIHETRLRGLYVGTSSEAGLPRDAIEIGDAQRIIDMAEARLELARATKLHDFTASEESDLLWFFDAAEDQEKFRLMFGQKSLAKLKDLRDGRSWMHWLRQQFEEAEARGREQAAAELQKPRAQGPDALVQRWRVRVRFVTDSHTIRPKQLETWNQRVDWIKFSYLNKKNQLGVDIFLPNAVKVSQVYEAALDIANKLLVALNVGTRGFFWWSLPEHVDRYYDTIFDLEAKSELVAERRPALRIDWGGGPLEEKQLNEVILCYAMLPHGPDKVQYAPYLSYLNGIAIIAKSDIHFHAEGSAYQQFFHALTEALRLAGAWDPAASLADACRKEFMGLLSQEGEWEQLISLGESIERGPPLPTQITLNEVGVIKTLCEAFFVKTFRAKAQQRRETEDKESISDKGDER